eukprot:TRINITY_DN108478_c0_g1_i1.p1 TRINITY_DN108478_c0_g1~~TRINITY_DN108478_c0_g1_i1.p1  ORF type:complete len:150 (+),score=17.43 TRINITY_DN108478_c0_g1_i1:99-548(+)
MTCTLRGHRWLLLLLGLLHYRSQPPALLFRGIHCLSARGYGLPCRALRGSVCRAAKVAEVPGVETSFSHVHVYMDSLRPLVAYKALEAKLNTFAARQASSDSKAARRETWLALTRELGEPASELRDPEEWQAAGQDVVEQLLVSLGILA